MICLKNRPSSREPCDKKQFPDLTKLEIPRFLNHPYLKSLIRLILNKIVNGKSLHVSDPKPINLIYGFYNVTILSPRLETII